MADKQKFLDYDGVKLLKKNLDGEKFDRKILETNVFNDITDFSVLTENNATKFEFEDTTNYNLVTITFPLIDISDDLLYMANLKFINPSNGVQKEVYRIINPSELLEKDGNICCTIDAAKTGIGDFINSNPTRIDEIKNGYLIGILLSCQILDNYDYESTITVNGINNKIDARNYVVVNGQNNNIYGDTTNSLLISGKNNDIRRGDYELIVGINNKENTSGLGLTVGSLNNKNYTDYSSIIGTRNYQWFGTYIPKKGWQFYDIDTTVIPVVATIGFSISADYNFLQGNMPQVGDKIGVHTFYGIRPSTLLEVDYDENTQILSLTFKSVDSSESDATLQWGNTMNMHGLLISNVGYNQHNTFIAGEYNSSYAYGSGIFGFGNASSGGYSFIAGRHNNVLAEHASALGWGNIISTENGTVLGSFNTDKENSLLIVGNGTTKFNRSNALVLSKDGQLTIAGDLLYNNGTSSVTDKITALEEQTNKNTLVYSLYKPTEDGNVGDIVYNEEPFHGSCVGWVYTNYGWLPFGTIENKKTTDWDYDFDFNSQNTMKNTPFFIEDCNDITGNITNDSFDLTTHSNYKQLKDVNGYNERMLKDNMTENDYILTGLPASTLNNKYNTNLWFEFEYDSSTVVGNMDNSSNYEVEFDIFITTPTTEQVASVMNDLIEFRCYLTTNYSYSFGVTGEGYVSQYNGIENTIANRERSQCTIGKIPLNKWVTLKLSVRDYNTIEFYIDDKKIELRPSCTYELTEENQYRYFEISSRCDYLLFKDIRVKKYCDADYLFNTN